MEQDTALVFSNITAEQFSILTGKARGVGIDLQGNSGSTTKYGVEVAWNYLPETLQLSLQCLKTPFFVKPADVYAKLQELVQETVG